MNKFYVRLLLLLLAMGFCIFFGVDLATRGVERIQGPIDKAGGAPAEAGLWPQPYRPSADNEAGFFQTGGKAGAEAEAKAKRQEETKAEPRGEVTETTGVAHIGNKTGELLQIVAHHGIQLFVSLFEAITS
ncbi:hypothetical protein [Paenibacillus xerothermodurans]|uniref:DUF3679 domain-containing protein n=1 Tax=Paenibacillus xerothermodurans TaxID=1977292 RepID=A0A2W1NDF0_PAEXE|nr:hypothetical protein [Paenibacillus xerothermodurans]PZE22729.1 hypothetical protein CBW46_002895 [Paenibacillus xerothermodurans]